MKKSAAVQKLAGAPRKSRTAESRLSRPAVTPTPSTAAMPDRNTQLPAPVPRRKRCVLRANSRRTRKLAAITAVRARPKDRESPPVSAYSSSHSAAPWRKAKMPSIHQGVGSGPDRDIETQTDPSRKRTSPKKK